MIYRLTGVSYASLALVFFFFELYVCSAQKSISIDTCTANDVCETAIPVTNVMSDSSYVCIDGCTLEATPDTFSAICSMNTLPTVWYKVFTDDRAHLLNVRIKSADISAPKLSIYRLDSTCASIQPMPLPLSSTYCRTGWNGGLDLYGLVVDPLTTYVIAVTSDDTIGGSFQICVNTVEERVQCLIRGDIQITSRSSGLGEDEPYMSGEQVGVCMAVKEYQTGDFNGCQWFQGLVPYFGSAWDPSSFDDLGQPFNGSINGLPLGDTMNGNYVNATWDWFADIGYHWTNDVLQIGDIDGNSTPDLCSALYEDCPDFGGVTGGCCAACWDDSGQLLPGGWFAYGINGSCAEKGHPTVDWGDGNTCRGSMGPWYFCFDLKVKSFPDCLQHDPDADLRLSYYTKADGETGSFTGGSSVCVNDKPRIRHLPLSCGTNVQDLDSVLLPGICSGDTISYMLSEPGVIHWYWNIEPREFSYPSAGNTPNGTSFQAVFTNPTTAPVDITYFLRGSLDSIGSYVSRKLSFTVYPGDFGLTDDHLEVCGTISDSVTYTVNVEGNTDDYTYLWMPGGDTTPYLTIYPPYQDTTFTVMVTDSNGCMQDAQLFVSIDSTCVVFDFYPIYDESNEHQTEADLPPIVIGKITNQQLSLRTKKPDQPDVVIYPIPAKDKIRVKWSAHQVPPTSLTIMNMDGRILKRIPIHDQFQNYLEVGIAELPEGIYIAVLQNINSSYTSRFVKM
jgi:hypothetical protein